jgi:pimeloyl-ACP methyl ester carboxylesterase
MGQVGFEQGETAGSTRPTGDRLVDWARASGLEERSVAAADGTRLRVLVGGASDGPRLVFVHGFPQHAASWRRVIDLVRGTFRVIAYDQRGYGRSEPSRTPGLDGYDLETLSADLASVIEATAGEGRPGPVHLCAHDWGGPVAWHLLGTRPELVAHHVSVNGPHFAAYCAELLGNRAQQKGAWYVAMFQIPGVEHALAARAPALMAALLRRSSAPGTFTDEDVALYGEPMADPGRLGAALAYYRAAARRLVRDRARAKFAPILATPTIVLWGQRDPALARSMPEVTRASYCPGAEIRRLPEASHWVPDERPDEVARALLDGLARVG